MLPLYHRLYVSRFTASNAALVLLFLFSTALTFLTMPCCNGLYGVVKRFIFFIRNLTIAALKMAE
ncbi:MAG: hypothetical protein LBT89_03250 [Planctomycetaceae bacterium]|jgi:hypothetical protein|nr:hypothetical protein [Planctomycetaceae bacterium]